MTGKIRVYGLLAILFIAVLACNAPGAFQPTSLPALPPPATEIASPATQAVPTLQHVQIPSDPAVDGNIIYDVESSGTGQEKRAPYGDSYDLDLLERPFLKDMTYVPDLDINTFNVSSDQNFHFVSIKLIGNDPNNTLGIDYAVELDTDRDGFGDLIIWAQPPYTNEWTTGNVQVLADKNHDTGGVSAIKSDAHFAGDGYETLVFDGATGSGGDPDLAWVRMKNTANATLQFAFKRSLAGDVFMIGVLADAGLKDAAQLDYVDRFTETEAGSPVKDKKYYPLQSLYSVDNTCREAIGFNPTGEENRLCPAQQSPAPGQPNQPAGCQPPGGSCPAGYYWWPAPHCACSITPYHP